jgi:DNA-binding Lrp family transcriptional regulator
MIQKEDRMEGNMLVESNNEKRIAGMTLQKETPLDSTHWHILRELQRDARLSYRELGRRVGLSAPGAAERVRKLEDAGVLMGYQAQLNLAKVGLPLTAWIQLRCAPGKCLMKTTRAADIPKLWRCTSSAVSIVRCSRSSSPESRSWKRAWSGWASMEN